MRGSTPRMLGNLGFLTVLGLAVLLLPLVPTWAQQDPEAAKRTDSGDPGRKALDKAWVEWDKENQELEALKRAVDKVRAQLEEKAAVLKSAEYWLDPSGSGERGGGVDGTMAIPELEKRMADLERKLDRVLNEIRALRKSMDKGAGGGDANSFSAREVLGEYHRNLAKNKADAADLETSTEEKGPLEKERAENLEKARETFLQLAHDLENKAFDLAQQSKSLSASETALLRKSQFVVAECGIDLPRWFADSCERYLQLWQRYRNDIDGLEACGKLYLCLLKAQKENLNVDHIREAAENAVEYYFHLDDSEMTAMFPNDSRRKAEWQTWLKAVHEDFQRTSKRRGN
jgi:hypothetical protein